MGRDTFSVRFGRRKVTICCQHRVSSLAIVLGGRGIFRLDNSSVFNHSKSSVLPSSTHSIEFYNVRVAAACPDVCETHIRSRTTGAFRFNDELFLRSRCSLLDASDTYTMLPHATLPGIRVDREFVPPSPRPQIYVPQCPIPAQ